MTEAPEKIWVEPPYYTISGVAPKITWNAKWDEMSAQSFESVRENGEEYILKEVSDALVAANWQDGFKEGEAFTRGYRKENEGPPTDFQEALESRLKQAREEALREALDAAREYRYRRGEAVENAILALIDKDNSPKTKKPKLVGTGVQVGLLKENPGS